MSKYEKWLKHDGLVRIQGWARDGLTDKQIAYNMGISRSTLNVWRKQFPDLSDTISKGKEVVDREVENSLLKRALGTKTTDKMYRMVHKDADVLEMERRRFSNQWKLDHPKASLKEVKDAAIAEIPEYKRIQQTENVHELPPDVNAAALWLKNRRPDVWRNSLRSDTELNDAQKRKLKAEADVAEEKARSVKSSGSDVAEQFDKMFERLKEPSDQ